MSAQSGFWITYHWAHPNPDDLPWHIYRKTLNKLDAEINVGDEVLFFHGLRPCDASGERLTHAVRVHNRIRTRVALSDEPAGIVCAGRVKEAPRKLREGDIKYDYFNPDPFGVDSNNLQSWHYITECEALALGGPVSLTVVHRVLGSKIPAHTLGLRRISQAEYGELRRLL